jgi:hypothetical protein
MNETDVYEKLSGQLHDGYRINELIPFSYPLRRVKLLVLVNKQPDGSLVKVYSSLLSCIDAGFSDQKALFDFLGLSDTDEFILRELFQLREKGLLDLISEKWIVTDSGKQFLQDNTIYRHEEVEEFEFLIDGISGEILSSVDNHTGRELEKKITPQLKLPKKSPDLIKDKFLALAEVYKNDHKGTAYLISCSENEIRNDREDYCNYWLIEYVPEKGNPESARLEIRSYDSLKPVKQLTEKFNAEYRYFIHELSSSERIVFSELQPDELPEEQHVPQQTEGTTDFRTLAIWETKNKFIEALKSVKQRILIESPWIKRATKEYIPYFETILQAGKRLIILYGISEHDEHDHETVMSLLELQKKYSKNFSMIHLPGHFRNRKLRLTGTHRKLVIKDDEYYIAGSFNFLSFGKQQQQVVANEESILVMKDVQEKWKQVKSEYQLSF